MASFIINVMGAPYTSQAPHSALRFARAALAQGHTIVRVFFYADGVHTGSALACPPQDEPHIPQQWQTLAESEHIELVICVAAALRRGIINESEAKRYGLTQYNLRSGFSLSGLGQWAEGIQVADRTITFQA
ncbi:sulfurtransferase TusD [Terasakiispira papahanaumokuakeensis]|uniref:Sulfurtransferase TusD n=1 Tax=Terasakiispira papahanaumokuakeensis TaxID=197479 RepID=A0A1E2VER9_9GAMM|nr:sulfurtransferase complex subunit TusD [Terasakiispira papahanaumokuakeensis]ODC05326.1 sulfurtransferase TusD [Terasakiispira papahanaumokuakeensis]